MLQSSKIRVLIVDDSALMRTIIQQGLSKHPQIEVVGHAVDTTDARKKIEMLAPQVVTMDVEMPGMSGIDFIKRYLPTNPIPVILVSSLNLRVFDALAAGALDFVKKPDGTEKREAFMKALTEKIMVASQAKIARPTPITRPIATGNIMGVGEKVPLIGNSALASSAIIGIGASTGGTEAGVKVLQGLPADIPPMLIVQHMPVGFTAMYAQRLDKLCAMKVKEAQDGDKIMRGVAYLAPAGMQMRVVRTGTGYALSCKDGEKVSGHCPSVDALFMSMAETIKAPMVGVIMTGMGSDGAAGLLAMRKNGAYTIGQDKDSSVVYGMPKVAFEMGAVAVQAPCERISQCLINHLKR